MTVSASTKLFAAAFAISLGGRLPVGILNVSVAGYMLRGDPGGAVGFGAGAILSEIVLVRVALGLMGRWKLPQQAERVFRLAACLFFLLLAGLSLNAAFHRHEIAGILPYAGRCSFLTGLSLGALNPLLIPFWLGWTVVLARRGIWIAGPGVYCIYLAGIGSGSAVALFIYGLAGGLLVKWEGSMQYGVNLLMGLTFLFLAFRLGYRLWHS